MERRNRVFLLFSERETKYIPSLCYLYLSLTFIAVFAESIASQGFGKSRNTISKNKIAGVEPCAISKIKP